MNSIRKIVSVLLCALMICSVFVPAVGAVEKYSMGDVDGNGRITASDARLALRASVNLEKLYVKAIKAADVNGDDDVTAADARTILRVSVGLESFGNLPVVSGKMPVTTAEICNFYKNGVDRIKNGEAGYLKKEWQIVDRINVGNSAVNSAVESALGNFLTDEKDVAEQVNAKGSDEAKNRIAAWTLTDLSKVAWATCVADGSNYKITITMMDEDTPKKSDSFLGQVTNSILYWEDIDDTYENDSTVNKLITSFADIHVIYKGYKIEAVMTPDGKFVSIDHTADVDIIIGEAKILNITVRDKSAHMWNYCKFYDFVY